MPTRTKPDHGIDDATASLDYVAFQRAVVARFRELDAEVKTLAPRYQNAEPVPFIVLDDFLPEWVAEAVANSVPDHATDEWTRLPTEDQKRKYSLSDDTLLPTEARLLIQELNSGYFMRFLEKLTGIPELIADTKMTGGGLHLIERGGKLSVHVDFSHHPTNGLNRRLNLLLYLNKEWKEEYGGHFEFWDTKITRCEQRILPVFNRCVVFSTSPRSYHGHPEPLACPEGRTRKSVALYYFSNGRDDEGDGVEHNTLFKSRPSDAFHLGNFVVRTMSSGLVRDLIPPLFYRAIRKFWNRKI